jgi:hypothetical protein
MPRERSERWRPTPLEQLQQSNADRQRNRQRLLSPSPAIGNGAVRWQPLFDMSPTTFSTGTTVNVIVDPGWDHWLQPRLDCGHTMTSSTSTITITTNNSTALTYWQDPYFEVRSWQQIIQHHPRAVMMGGLFEDEPRRDPEAEQRAMQEVQRRHDSRRAASKRAMWSYSCPC